MKHSAIVNKIELRCNIKSTQINRNNQEEIKWKVGFWTTNQWEKKKSDIKKIRQKLQIAKINRES